MHLADLTLRHSALLQRLAERTEAVLEVAHLRVMAAEGSDFPAEVALFSDLGRALRLTLALEMRLMTLTPASHVVTEMAQPRPKRIDDAEQHMRADRPERLSVERETETEGDGYPATALGRAEALEGLLLRSPALDPDGRVTAEIIQIKAFLSEAGPEDPNPEPPEPPEPPRDFGLPVLSRPPNRAERRRLRRSSG